MHACSCRSLKISSPSHLSVHNSADNPWPESADVVRGIVNTYKAFTDLGGISARFAARLVKAGALHALEDLVATTLMREALRYKAGAIALVDEASADCLATLGRSIPQVRRQVAAAGSACCSCMFKLDAHPSCNYAPGISSAAVQCWQSRDTLQLQVPPVHTNIRCE